jgi:iron complex outermembrane receptor protein
MCSWQKILRSLLFIAVLLWQLPVGAQQRCSLVISGKVTDDHTSLPLEGATVHIEGTDKNTTTASDGSYQFTNLCPGSYKLLITHINCDRQTITVTLKSNQRRDILMHHTKVELQGVTVQGLRVNNTQVIEKVNTLDVANNKAMGLGDVVKNINGVTLLSTGSTITKPVIHGLHSNRILIMNNGVRLEGQQWGSEHAPEVDPYMAGRFQVIKGAAAVRYGADAIAGVVLVEPRPMPSQPGLQGEFNGAFLSNNLMGVANAIVEQKLAKSPLSWRVQATAKKGGTTRIPGFWLANTGVEELNYSGTIGYKKERWGAEVLFSAFNTKLGLYPGAHVETVAELDSAIKSPVPLPSFQSDFTYNIGRPRQEVQHYTGRLSAFYKIGTKTRLNMLLAHQENRRDEYDSRAFIQLPEMSLDLGTTSGELVFEKTFSQKHLLQIGSLVQRQENVNGAISARQFIRNYKSWMAGGFAIYQFTVNRFDIEAGTRYDYRFFESYYRPAGSPAVEVQTRDFNNLSGSVGVMYRLSPGMRLRANVASAWRPPSPNELYANGVHQGLAAVEIGNPDFKAERALNMNIEWQYNHDSSFSATVTLYHNRIRDFIYLAPTPPPILTIRGYYPVFTYRQTDASFTGADLQTISRWGRLAWTAKASLLYARDLDADDWLIFMPPNRLENSIDWSFKPARNNSRYYQTYAGANWLWVTEQTRIPDADVAVDYAPPPAAYHLFGLEAGTTHRSSGIELGLNITNLFNASYRDYLNRLRYFSDAAGINVQLRARIPFHIHKHS